MTNTGNNIHAEGLAPEAQSKMEQIRDSLIQTVLESSRTRIITIAAAIGITAQMAAAQESMEDRTTLMASVDAPVAELVTDGSYRVAGMLPQAGEEGFTPSPEAVETVDDSAWLNNLDLSNPDIAEFLLPRVDDKSFEYARNHLRDFALLSHDMQAYIVQASHGIGGYTDEQGNVVAPLEPEETQLLSYLRVPLTLRTAMSDYLIENGDITEERIAELTPLIEAERLSRSQTRGFTQGEVTYVRVQRMLNKLEKSGDLSMREFAFIEKSVGDLYHAIPQVIDLRIAREGRLVAEANADAAEARAEETTAERLAAEARADTAEERTILLALLADSAGRAAESGARAVESGTEAVETIIN